MADTYEINKTTGKMDKVANLAGKEDISNKTATSADLTNSEIKYPAEKAMQEHVQKWRKPLAYYTPHDYIGNPIINPGVGKGFRDVSKIFNIGGTYHCYGTYTPVSAEFIGVIRHYSAPTEFGPWSEGSIVISAGAAGQWDSLMTYAPEVTIEGDTIYIV